jgi:Na+/H+ antiporter NhaD/arsenite permease-like protein
MASRNVAQRRQTSYDGAPDTRRKQRSHPASGETDGLMGSIIRRKTVTSLPLGAQSEFWGNQEPAHPASAQVLSAPSSPKPNRRETRTPSFVGSILRRKQVSLDLLSQDQANFFAPVPAFDAEEKLAPAPEDFPIDDIQEYEEYVHPEERLDTPEVKLFRPLRFAPFSGDRSGGHGGHGGGHGAAPGTDASPAEPDEATIMAVERQVEHNETLKLQLHTLYEKMDAQHDSEFMQDLRATQEGIDADTILLQDKILHKKAHASERVSIIDEETEGDGDIDEDGEIDKLIEDEYEYKGDIIRATKSDYYWTGLLGVIMLAFTIMLCVWDTHLDESALIRSPVGYACATPCLTQTFFEEGHNTFKTGQVIELIMHLDPNHDTESHAVVEIVGVDSGAVKAVVEFGPANEEERTTEDEQISVDFDNPGEEHIIQVVSTNTNTTLTFTLHAVTLSSLAEYSVIIAAIVLVSVYILILLEVIHRTLIAIFGSMVALFFLFLIHGGNTVSIASVMLFMEWSTLGLLFGMMIIVGELSHTGIFEYFAVRLLMSSKGSFRRLMLLLCGLTAVASAFLDNVTTMLLVAPVTIDMCKILDVDPRPYLIGEVILSNVGGTATLIGDPPNIIIGTSIESIDFVDFIINIAPCVFFFLIPVSLAMILWLYNYYFTAFSMPELDTTKLKKTYPIYDQPRLLITGTVAFFVILLFFLHPVHHKDTAWIALIGALLTITFTNPHDVQDALRNHIEWDTLLFFAGLFVLVEACAELGLLDAIGDMLGDLISAQPESSQLPFAITLIMWVSAIASAFIDNIPWTATMIPIIKILAEELPTLPIETLAWALSLGACLGGNGTLLGASANIVTAGIATNKGYNVSFLNFLYPGFLIMLVTVAISNLYMLVVYVWI